MPILRAPVLLLSLLFLACQPRPADGSALPRTDAQQAADQSAASGSGESHRLGNHGKMAPDEALDEKALAPYFSDGPWTEILSLYHEGKPDQALARLRQLQLRQTERESTAARGEANSSSGEILPDDGWASGDHRASDDDRACDKAPTPDDASSPPASSGIAGDRGSGRDSETADEWKSDAGVQAADDSGASSDLKLANASESAALMAVGASAPEAAVGASAPEIAIGDSAPETLPSFPVESKSASPVISPEDDGPDSERRGAQFYLSGRILASANQHLEAAAAFESAAQHYEKRSNTSFAHWSRCQAALQYEAAEKLENALVLYPSCIHSTVPEHRKSPLFSQFLSLPQHQHSARELLEGRFEGTVVGGSPTGELLSVVAALEEKEGRIEEAIALLKQAWIQDPASQASTDAEARLLELVRTHPSARIEAEDHLERAEAFHSRGDRRSASQSLNLSRIGRLCPEGDSQHPHCKPLSCENFEGDLALDQPYAQGPLPLPACAVEEVHEPADPVVCRAEFLQGQLLRSSRKHTLATATFRRVYQRCDDPELRVRALFLSQASASPIRHDDAIGLAWLLALQFPESTLGDDALLAAANLARRQENSEQERALLRWLSSAYPDGDMRSTALFRLFWSYRNAGEALAGLHALETTAREHDVSSGGVGADAERARYWWGRTLVLDSEGERLEEGLQALAKLARERPLTYYGVLARSFLDDYAPDFKSVSRVPPPAANPASALRPGPLAREPLFAVGLELLKMGLAVEAEQAFLAIPLHQLDLEDPLAREGKILVANLVARCGNLREAHSLIRFAMPAWIRSGDEPLASLASRLAYPLAYRELISRHSEAHGVHADFVQGLMREESSLDPRALSPVGARGLTQLMPATAKQVAASLGIRRFNVDSLWEPDLNIRFGATYLSRMLQRFGHPVIAAAAYNAGPTAVSRWMNQRGDLPLDEFVENIPYAETQGYVKRVLRSYATYRYLYGEEDEQLLSVSMSLRGRKDEASNSAEASSP